jgi:hypothetical protein
MTQPILAFFILGPGARLAALFAFLLVLALFLVVAAVVSVIVGILITVLTSKPKTESHPAHAQSNPE